MPLEELLILAVVQGIAEFLPISSSGHVVIVSAALGSPMEDVVDVNIVLHAGTLLSILVFYWHRVWRLLGADRHTIPLLIVGTIPAVVVGLTVKLAFEALLENPLLAGCMLLVTASFLLISAHFPVGTRRYEDLSYRSAFWIGCAQALAILPGISRSGATISAGLGLQLSRADAATFSFLLAIPVIGGASVLELKDIVSTSTALSTPVAHLAAGAAVAFVVGLFSLWWLLRWLEKGRLEYFAYWCLVVGIGVIVWRP